MEARQAVNSLDLYDNGVLDDNVEAISDIEPSAVVDNWEWRLPSEGDSAHSEFVRQTVLVGRFQQSWTKRAVHFQSGIDDILGEALHRGG